MQLREMFISCLRRWYFVIVGLLVTAAGTYGAYMAVHPTYDAKASIVLIPPKVAITTGDNPYLYLGGLDQALGVLQVKVSAPEVSGDLVKRYPGGILTVTRDVTTSGPILAISATADDPSSVMKLLQGAEDLVPSTLATLQAQLRVPPDSVITSMKLSSDDVPTKVSKSQLQTMAMVAVGGVAGTVVFVGLIDRLMARRARMKPVRTLKRALKKASKERHKAEEPVESEEPNLEAGVVTVTTFGTRVRGRFRPSPVQHSHRTVHPRDAQTAGDKPTTLAPASWDDARP